MARKARYTSRWLVRVPSETLRLWREVEPGVNVSKVIREFIEVHLDGLRREKYHAGSGSR